MVDEFFSTSLGGTSDKPKKRTVRKSAPRKRASSESFEKVDEKLTKIYKDEDGKMPNMKQWKIKPKNSMIGRVFSLAFVGIILAAIAWAGFLYIPTISGKFAKSEITFTVEGPQSVEIGATSTYKILFHNTEKVKLNGANLTINYPEGFMYLQSSETPVNNGKNEWNFGIIEPNQKKEIEISGRMIGEIGVEQSWRAFLNYIPANFKSEMQKTATLVVKTEKSPFEISIAGPDKTAVGAESKIKVSIVNKGEWTPEKIIIAPVLPANFYISSSTPVAGKNGSWEIPLIIGTSTIKTAEINLVGKFSNSDEENAPIKMRLMIPHQNKQNYLAAESELKVEMLKSSVSLNGVVNGAVAELDSKPGDTLNFAFSIKNNGKTDITKTVLKVVVSGPSAKKQSVINWAEIEDKNDADVRGEQVSDSVRKATLQWSRVSALSKIKGGQEVIVEFQVPIKATDKAPWGEIEENKITVTPEVTYVDSAGATQLVSGNLVTITLNSDFTLDVRDEVNGDKHNITWVLENSFHTLKNIVLSAEIFGDVTAVVPTTTPAGTLTYDANSKKITWRIPEMNESTDVLAYAFSAQLNKKDPTQNMLVSKVRVEALDTVTNKKIEFLGDEIGLKISAE